MIIWRGFGIAVAGLAFAALVGTELGVESWFSDERYYQDHGWPKLLGLTLGAALVWLLCHFLDKRRARVVIDKQTGEELTLPGPDHFFFVPLRYWPAILVALGFILLLLG